MSGSNGLRKEMNESKTNESEEDLLSVCRSRLMKLQRARQNDKGTKQIELLINESGARVWIYRQFYDPVDAEFLMKSCQEQLSWAVYERDTGFSSWLTPRLMSVLADADQETSESGTSESRKSNSKIAENPNYPSRKAEAWGRTEAGLEIFYFKELLNELFECNLTSCLLNRYRDKRDYIAYHSDREVMTDPTGRCFVFGLSLGQERPFYFKRKTNESEQNNRTTNDRTEGEGVRAAREPRASKPERSEERGSEGVPNEVRRLGKIGDVIQTTICSGDLMLMEGKTQHLFTHSVPKRTAKNLNWGERISLTFRE